MEDHSHKLFFLGLTGLMCVAALYGSQVGPEMFAGTPAALAAVPATAPSGTHQGLVTAAFHLPQVPQASEDCATASVSRGAERTARNGPAKPGLTGSCARAIASGANDGTALAARATAPPS